MAQRTSSLEQNQPILADIVFNQVASATALMAESVRWIDACNLAAENSGRVALAIQLAKQEHRNVDPELERALSIDRRVVDQELRHQIRTLTNRVKRTFG